MIAVLRQRNFALLWFAGLISMLGDWVLFIALPIHIYNLTHSSLATGLMFMASTLPHLVLGSVAGVFVDRWDRQRTMVMADFSRALLLLLLLLVQSPDWIWLIYLVAFGQATISQFFGPAENALLPQLVDESHIVAANSLNSLNNNLARLAGPALGGLLLSLLGFTSVILIDSLSFLISGVMIALIAQPALTSAAKPNGWATEPLAPVARPQFWQDWLAGLRLIRSNSVVLVIFLVMGIVGIAEGLFNVMFVIFVRQILGGEALEFGWLTSAQAVGGLGGSLLIGWVGHRVSPNRLVALLAVNGLLVLTLINFPSLPLALLLLFLAGAPITGYAVGIDTLLQKHVVSEYRGRVFGALGTSVAVFMLLGQGLASSVGDYIGVVVLLNLKGLLDLSAGFVALIWLNRVREAHPPPRSD